jgi:DNA-binding Lrp family transcriptional regulator
MENVFAEMGAQITTGGLVKPKRSAFVFITAESDDSCHCALEDLRRMEEVQEVYLAKGAYDLVAKVNGESLDQLREIISKRIRNLSSIKSTLTLTIV